MGSIQPGEPSKLRELRHRIDQCDPQLKDVAHQKAYEFRLPWELPKLRKAGEEGVLKASKERKDQALGLPFPQAASGEIRKTIQAAAVRLRAQREGEDEISQPTGENIQEALETFSRQEWQDLIAEFEEQDLNPLRSYLDTHRDELELEHQLGRIKFGTVFGSAVERSIILRCLLLRQRGARMIPVTDPMWAAFWVHNSRQRKMEGAPRPSKRRSWEEMAGYRGIAEALSQGGPKVTDKKVKTYLERMEQVPIEQFDGDAFAYYSMIADTRTFKQYLRSQGRGASRDE